MRQVDEGRGGEDEEGWDVAEVLAHADAHGGAEPAADGVEQAGLAGSLSEGCGWGEEGGIGYQGYGIEGDADGVEEGG